MPRFVDLVPELLADVRRSPDPGSVELEALGFAMTLERMSEEPAVEAEEVVAALRAAETDDARAALRVLGLFAPRTFPAAEPAGDVGTLAPTGVWRAESDDVVVHLAWFERPGSWPDQSFTLVTGPDRYGAPLLGGGMGTAPADESADTWRAAVVEALGTAEPVPVEADDLLSRLRLGAATNRAAVVEVSAALAMGARIAAVALGVSDGEDQAFRLPWSVDDTETDDERAAYLQRLLLSAVSEGVDVRDPAALAAWTAELQRGRPREQLRRLGLGSEAPDPARSRPRAPDGAKKAKRKAARKARKRNR